MIDFEVRETRGVHHGFDMVGFVFEDDGSVGGDSVVVAAFLERLEYGGRTVAISCARLHYAYFLLGAANFGGWMG